MPLTPEDVSNKRFTPVRLREGYDMGEVDQFLDEVESELERLHKENDDLRSKLSAAQGGGQGGESAGAEKAEAKPEPKPEPAQEAGAEEKPQEKAEATQARSAAPIEQIH